MTQPDVEGAGPLRSQRAFVFFFKINLQGLSRIFIFRECPWAAVALMSRCGPQLKKNIYIFFFSKCFPDNVIYMFSVSDVWDGFEFCKEYRNSSEGGTKAMGGLRCDSL